MKSIYKAILICFTIGAIFSCGGNNPDKETLEKAAKVHTQLMKLEKDVAPSIDKLLDRHNQIQTAGRQLTVEEKVFSRKVRNLEGRYKIWKDNIIEVPGAEHDHSHGDGHHHHKPSVELLPADLLAVQYNLMDSLKVLEKIAKNIQLP